LELAHRIILAQSLANRLRDQQQRETYIEVKRNFWRYLIPAALLVVWSVFFYFLIR